MKKIKTKLFLFCITLFIISCSNDDDDKIAGLNDISGNFRLTWVNTNDQSLACATKYNITSSNDLEITSKGRFKQKFYAYSNNECTLIETLEGQITITGSWYEQPYGNVEYDNSENIYEINFDKSVNGKHNEARLDIYPGSGQYFYKKDN